MSTVFDADAAADRAAAEPGHEPFCFEWHGTRHDVPHPLCLQTRQLKRFHTLEQTDGPEALDYLAELWPADAYEALMDMPPAVTGQVMRAWLRQGEDAGKKSARSSTSSPKRAATKQRKQT
jgi:hypothetical protein